MYKVTVHPCITRKLFLKRNNDNKGVSEGGLNISDKVEENHTVCVVVFCLVDLMSIFVQRIDRVIQG